MNLKSRAGRVDLEGLDDGPDTVRHPISGVAAVQRVITSTMEADRMRAELAELKAAGRVIALDPQQVGPSRWANRDEASFNTADFEALKEDILSASGNVQPIKVREVINGATPYEIIYGHRRHRACLELGLPVNAIVAQLDDRALFEAMDRENRQRQDLSPWEQGRMYRRALNEGLYPSMRKMSESLGVSVGGISQVLTLADLPQYVLDAFPSPLELQHRWAADLRDACARDADKVKRACEAIKSEAPRPDAREVFTRLVGSGVQPLNVQPVEVLVRGKKAAVIKVDGKGRAQIEISAGKFDPEKLDHLAVALEGFLEKYSPGKVA